MEFEGKVALVTGAASGIGRATARLLASRGAAVGIADINAAAAVTVADELTAQGLKAEPITVDIEQDDQIAQMVAHTVEVFGGLDILHNNAALFSPAVMESDRAITDIDPALYARVLKVNLIGYAMAAQYAIPHMLERGGGVIVNTSSATGLLAELIRPMYGSSKAGIMGLTRSIATQYGHRGVRCVSISPGFVFSEEQLPWIPQTMQDQIRRHSLIDRLCKPEDVAALVAFLASDSAGYITGVNVPIDGGMGSHFPSYAEDLAGL